MKYGYCRVSTKGQLDGNSIQDQINQILESYADAEIIIESYGGVMERAIFNELLIRLICVVHGEDCCEIIKNSI